MDYLIFFLVLLIILGIIAVIGHLIWLAVAAIFHALFGKPEQAPVELRTGCAECGAALRITDDFCAVCGHGQKPKAASPLEELATVARQMDRFLNQGKLDPTTHRRVMKAIEEDRERLANPPRHQPTASSTPGPVSAPVNATAPPVAKPQPTAPQPAAVLPEPDFSRSGGFSGSRVEAVIQQPVVAAPPQPIVQPEPRRSLTEMLETFMEESSIRWGELIGGLLIIGCSLALVISLWSQIKGEPVLKFSVFIGMTAGLFGMGFYSAHRWKLPTTSRGALIISTLLVPLNFLAMTAFSQSAAPNAPIIIGGELLALLLFLFLVYQAGNVIAPGNSWLLAGATLVPSLGMLMARHGHGTGVATMFLSLAPMISYWVSTGVMLRGRKKEREEDDSEAERMFALFGVASFASLLPVALLIAKSGNIAAALQTFAPLIALAGVPAIAVGLTLKQAKAGLSGHSQIAATSIAILGVMLAVGGLALAWPRPLAVIGVALINCVICAAIAWRFNLKQAHAASLAFFVLAYLIGANVVAGDFPSWSEDGAHLTATFVGSTGGLAWLTLFILFGAGAEAWRRFGQKTESRLYEFAAFCSAFISLSLLTWRGFGRAGDPQHLALVYIFYAAAAFAIAWYRNQFVASWIGACLSLLAIVQAFVYEFGYGLAPRHPVRLSLLVYASLATIAAVVLLRAGEKTQRIFARPLAYAALLSSIAIAPFVLLGGWMNVGQMSSRLLWLAGIWLVLSVMKGWPKLFTAFQVALSVGVVCGVAAIFDSRALPSHSSWLNPHLLQAEGIALVLLSLTWLLLRIRLCRRVDDPSIQGGTMPIERLLSPSWPAVDRVVTVVAWLLLIWLCVGGVTDGMAMRLIPVEQSYVTFREFALRSQGAGSWLLLLALLLAFVVSLWEEFRKRAVIGLMTLVACACMLLAAGRWRGAWLHSPFSWSFAASFALVALPIIFRNQVHKVCEQFHWPRMNSNSDGLASLSRGASIALFAVPALALTALSFLGQWELDRSTSFTAMALILSPLVVLSLTLAAHGVRERSAGYAFAAGLMLNLAVTLGVLLADAKPVRVIQSNLMTSAIFSLLWLVVSRRLASREAEEQTLPSMLLRLQIGFTLLAALALLAVADVRLLADLWPPSQPSLIAAAMGGAWGWLTVVLPALAFARLHEWRLDRLRVDWLGVALLAAVSLIGCSVSLEASGWAVYYALMIAIAASAWLMLALRWKREAVFNRFKQEGNDTSVWWATGLGLAQLALTLYSAQLHTTLRGIEAYGDVGWTCGSLATLCLLFTGLAIVTRQRGYVYLSGLLFNFVVTRLAVLIGGDAPDRHLILANVVALCLSSLVWLKLDLAVMRKDGGRGIAPFHRVAARVALVIMALSAISHWLACWIGDGNNIGSARLDWLALAPLAALLVGCLWDGETDLSWRGLHAAGLMATGMALASSHLSGDALLASTAAVLSLYALATVLLWHRREALTGIVNALRIPQRVGVAERMWAWLVKGNTLIAAFVALGSLALVFGSGSLKVRLFVTTAAFALPLAFALLAQMLARGERRRGLIADGIRLCLLDVLLWCWAWLQHPGWGASLQLINRLVIVMLIAEAVLIAYRLVAANQLPTESEWRTSWRDDLWWVAVVGLASLAVVLGVEVSNYAVWGSALISGPVILAVLVTLIGLCLIGLAFALLPGEDPFGLDERGRMRYVYAVEGFIVLALMHARVTMPWLFGGRFTAYWPMIVLAIAFAGVGLSELFRRQGKLILAEPLERTGALLPLLPVIGFWAVGSQVSYSMLLLLAGLFYGWLSVIRHSFAFALLAALAGNAGLWHFMHGEAGYAFSEHPQLWLIPAALSVLLATRITRKDGRDSLSAEQMSSIRYGALITIYVSSTADIFLNGVDDSPWLPIVLAVLSVCGVAAGIMLRIRSFLFLGTAFLLLSMLTMIWSASVNLHWAWLWWVTGIALGVFILYTFAMFERKREEMLRFVGRLKQWQ